MRDPAADYVRSLGLPFLAHLLRRLSDRLVAEAGAFEAERGVRAPPRTASTMLLLNDRGPQSVTAIAASLQQSHPLVIDWIRQLHRLGLVTKSSDPEDRRRSLVALTEAGRAEAGRMAAFSEVIGEAYATLLAEVDPDLHDRLWQLHDLVEGGRLADALRASPAAAR
ncbi:MAG TPA: MarR family transcriptional regulator [Allosphingosinicella sp.]|nr:MarR family transcriptional regulator [Allosphingosinicella sp.]